MSDIFIYPVIVVIAFGVCYSVYGRGIATTCLIQSLCERAAIN